MIYTHLVSFGNLEYVCRVARSIEDAEQLIEQGFEFVTEFEDAKLFRKPK